MTNQEAIEILKKDGWGYPENMHTEAVMMAIDALELQTPKELSYGRCPNCGVYFGRGELFGNWCQYCGQRLDIDWSEVEE